MDGEQNLREEESLSPEETSPGPSPATTDQAEAAVIEETAPAEVETLRQQLEEEQRKGAELYDQYLRSVAELRNFKKRVDQEREQLAREASAGLVARLLPILDDFERAASILPDEKLLHFSWIEGILLIHRRLQAALEQHGLRSIEAVGKSFDPYLHEAILFEEVPAQQDQTILAELQKGYKLYDRVLRPTLVKLGKATAVPLETTEQPGGTESPPHPPEEHTEPESA